MKMGMPRGYISRVREVKRQGRSNSILFSKSQSRHVIEVGLLP